MSLFSWASDVPDDRRGIFANSPREFFRFGASPGAHTPCLSPGFAALTSRGVLVEGQCCEEGQVLYLDLGVQTCDESNTKRYSILLERRADGTFQRTKSNVLEELPTGKVLKTGRIMASKGPVDFCDPASSIASKLSSSLDSGHQILPFRHAIPISLSKPTTPGFSRQSSGSSGSGTTLTGPSFSSCPSHLEEPDWVSIQPESQEAADSDGCDDLGGYGSMETSQQTEADRGWDSISEVSTAPSPPQDATEEPCQPSADRLCDSAITRPTSTAIHQSPFPATTVDDSQLKEQLSQFLLSQFVISQETWNHVAEKRERREKRSRDRSRHQAQKLKKRALGPPEFSCPFYVKNPERQVGCLINHELASMDDL
ncbi:het and ankyrin domain protein [Colletotrichum asianum]